MLEEKIQNLYLHYLEEDLGVYVKNYMNNYFNVKMTNEIDISAYWTIKRAINDETWTKKSEKLEAFNYCWTLYRNTLEHYEKRMYKKERTIIKKNKIIGFIK